MKAINERAIQAVPELRTERLTLRQPSGDDFAAFAKFYGNESASRYVGGPKTLDQAWRHFALMLGHWQLKGFGYWAVEVTATAEFAGCIGLWQSAGWPELELGYWLLEDFQGKGYASEAAKLCRDYARVDLQAPSMVSYIDSENLASIKLAESLGAQNEKTIELLEHGPHRVYRHF